MMRRTKPIKKGDYFLLPYSEPRIDVLVKVIRGASGDRHVCEFVSGRLEYIHLDGSRRIGPKLAKDILNTFKTKKPER